MKETASLQYLNQFFDKIFVISAARFTDRQARVNEKLNNISFDFFWGVDKKNITIEDAIKKSIYNEVQAKRLQRMSKPLSIGELACALSHRNLYQTIIENKWEKTLVFEDDIWPLYENIHQLQNTLEDLPADWDIVYLGYLRHENVTIKLKIKQFFYKIAAALGLMKWSYKMVCNLLPKYYSLHLNKAGFHDCAHSYAISLNGAKKLLNMQTPVVYRADDLLAHAILKGEVKGFVTKPKFFDQEDFHDKEVKSKIKND